MRSRLDQVRTTRHRKRRASGATRAFHVGRQHGTNRGAPGEEEVDHENLTGDILLRHRIAQLVDQGEWQDPVVFMPHHFGVHQCRIQIRRLVDGQLLIRSQQNRTNGNGHDGHADEQDDMPQNLQAGASFDHVSIELSSRQI